MPPRTSASSASTPDIQELLQSIVARLQSMEDNQSILANQLANQVARIERISETTSSPSVATHNDLVESLSVDPKLKVCLPDKFDGNPASYEVFTSALDNFFALKGAVYSNQEIKVRTVGTLLSGNALQWFGTLIREKSGLLKDFSLFMEELKRLFSDSNAKSKSQILLKRLKQGSGSVIHYSTRFRTIVINTGYNEEAKLAAFKSGLSDQIRDIMATSLTDPDTLEDLISLAIKIDTRIFDRKMETAALGAAPRTAAAVSSIGSTALAIGGAATGGSDRYTTSQMGSNSFKSRKRISNQERQRRIQNNLCLFCGESGHIHSGCPKKTVKNNSAGS